MRRFGLILVASLSASPSSGEPLLTIACDEPKGTRMEYGASVQERVRAEIDKKTEPKPQLRGPTKDGYDMRPTFVVDSGKKKLTVTWAESAHDAKLRKDLKAANLPAPSLPPATEAKIVLFSPDHISALEVISPNAVTVYSFFPKLGSTFFTTQAHELSGKDTRQMSVFSVCQFSWSNSR